MISQVNKNKTQKGTELKKVPSIKRSKGLQGAIDWVVENDATEEKDKLRHLMEATAFLENSFGANEKAYNRDYTNSHWSIDDGFLNDLVTKKDSKYDKVYNDYFAKYDAIDADRGNLKDMLNANDEIASALSARIKYAISPDPLPDTDVDSVVDYWYKHYNANKDFTKDDIDRKKDEYRKFLESKSESSTEEEQEFRDTKTKENTGHYYPMGFTGGKSNSVEELFNN